MTNAMALAVLLPFIMVSLVFLYEKAGKTSDKIKRLEKELAELKKGGR